MGVPKDPEDGDVTVQAFSLRCSQAATKTPYIFGIVRRPLTSPASRERSCLLTMTGAWD